MNLAVQKAVELINSGKAEEGLNELKKIVTHTDHETMYSIAEIYYQLGLVDLAKDIIEELLSLYPDEGELYTFMAELLIDLDEEDEAIEMLLEVKEDDPVYIQGQLLLADLYQLQGLDEVAEQKLLNAESKAPEEKVVLFGLGEFYLSRGDYLKSIPYYKRVLPFQDQLNGTNVSLRIAEAYSGSGYFEEAITYYQDGIDQDATVDDFFGYGYTALQLQQYSLAIKQFEKVLDTDESYSTVYAYLAEAYEEEGLVKEATQMIKKGLEVDEYNEALYVQGGRVCIDAGLADEGEVYLRKVLAINPANFEAANVLAHLLKNDERYTDLVELITYLKELGEEDPLFDWLLASAKWELEQFEEALQLYKQAFVAFDHDSDFLEEYANILLENGDRKEAKEILQLLVNIDGTKEHCKELLYDLDEDY